MASWHQGLTRISPLEAVAGRPAVSASHQHQNHHTLQRAAGAKDQHNVLLQPSQKLPASCYNRPTVALSILPMPYAYCTLNCSLPLLLSLLNCSVPVVSAAVRRLVCSSCLLLSGGSMKLNTGASRSPSNAAYCTPTAAGGCCHCSTALKSVQPCYGCCSNAASLTATCSSCSSLPGGPIKLRPTGAPSTRAMGMLTCRQSREQQNMCCFEHSHLFLASHL